MAPAVSTSSPASRAEAYSLQRLFELSPDLLAIASPDGYFTALNPAWERTLGWTAEELMAAPLASFVQPDDIGAAAGRAREQRWRARDGGYRLLDRADVSEHGVLYVVARDVTDRGAARAVAGDGVAVRSDQLHRILAANLPDTTVFLLDRDLRILVADGGAIRRLPWFDEDAFRGRLVTELGAMVPDDVLETSLATYRAALRGERGSFEFLSEGLTFSTQAVPVRGENGEVESVLVVASDITRRTRAEQRFASHARQQVAVAELGRFALKSRDLETLMSEAVKIATATLDVDGGGILELSDDGEDLTIVAGVGFPDGIVGEHRIGLAKSATAGYTLASGEPTIVADLAAETRFKPPAFLLGLGVVSIVSVPIHGKGRPYGVLDVRTSRLRAFSEDDVAFLVSIATLITVAVERHRDEQATRHAALHDPLSGLPNRTLALDRLGQALSRRRREHIDVAVFVLDVDRFKMINDSFGHAAGDEVLLALAARLIAAVRDSDTVARLGGDEYIVICPDVHGIVGATEIAERLTCAVTSRLVLDSGEHSFSISIGIALAEGRHGTPESLLGDADAAMYRAKERGRGRYELFDEAMRTGALARVRTENELRRAIERGELTTWYQPVIDLASGRPVSTEALVRWQHPERGLVSPLEFIPIAEDSGLIAELGLQVLEQACRQTAAWQRQLDPQLGVSVNISGRQVLDGFPGEVAAIAERSGLCPGTLALEITESMLMEEADSPATVLGSFQQYGLTLVLDDFGTGYSSLSRLKLFPLDVLKIDRSFVAGVARNTDDRAIVKATIDMAHAVGLTVVAEGVETREQERHLRTLGCDRAQGYLYARPQPAEAVTELLAAALR